MPGSGAIDLKDLESGAELRVGLGSALRQRFAESARRRREDLTRSFYRVPMDHVFVRADRPAIEPLLKLFAARRRV